MDLLGEAVTVLSERGVLGRLAELIQQVYRRTADRHEPDLGDDAMSFGTTVWRNLVNLGAAAFQDLPCVETRIEDNSLAILSAGYVLRLYSLQGGLDSNVQSIRWEGSEARLGGAVENSQAEQLALDDDGQFGPAFVGVVPRKRHLRVAHAGDIATGEAVAYIGLPRDNRDGGSPWFDVRLWFGEPTRTSAASSESSAEGEIPRQRHDELPIPELEMQLRLRRGATRTGTIVSS
ncbi:hypothetical protein HC031_14200 [Planosporangium thailandense]|uniref:Uncharacterized protein n=1 Tax=Planosporangium thailandense TaxID=765197 RepID=A0ABX0XXV4_9ACTN|nr:hypothetical protein [Planosporangium thailandense]NJC70860.1 hypothetical protein [Planosporangium thailandense]